MKNKRFPSFAAIVLVIAGLLIFFLHSPSIQSGRNPHKNRDQISTPESYQAASISKGTIFLLLAVGIVGVLGVSRKKKYREAKKQNNEIPDMENHPDRM
jgi:hypothetical protein